MADQKISDLTALTGANVADTDLLPIVDTSATETKKITFAEFKTALDTATGFVRITGDTMTGDLSFGDNNKAIFGAGSDLQIYHDGANSVIADKGTGHLLLTAPTFRLRNDAQTQEMLNANEGGAVTAYYSGSQKLATTATGISVTGTVVADGLTVDASAEAILSLNGYTASQNTEVQLVAFREDVSTSKSILDIKTNNGTSLVKRARFDWDGDITFYAADGTTPSFVYDESAGLTINEAGADRDFRVESDTNDNMLFVDGGNNRVGVGTGSPSAPLEIKTTGDGTLFRLNRNAVSAWDFSIGNTSTLSGVGSGALEILPTGSGTTNELAIGKAGTTEALVHITTSGTTFGVGAIFNESGADSDFRVESDTNANMLFVDASANRVGVGLNAPTRTLHVADSAADPYVMVDGSAGNRDSGFSIDAGAGQKIAIRGDSSGSLFYGNENQMLFNTAGAIFNEGGADLDFRVESDTIGSALSVDGGTGNVGVGSAGLTSTGPIATSAVGAAVTSFKSVCNQGDQTATNLILQSGRTDVYYHMQAFVSGTTEVFRIEASGNVKNTNNSYGAISDAKLKENVVDASPKLADLMLVKVRNYNLIGETTKQIGVVAQELEAVFPSMVDENADRDKDGNLLETTTKGVKYSVFVPMLIKAIQEQQATITALTARITALENA
jgi:hypothetical protein